MTAPTLRLYQNGSIDAVCDAREGKGGTPARNRLLVQMPTGCGKTVVFAAMLIYPRLAAWLGQFPKTERKMLVIAHREELLDQAADKIQRQNPHLRISIEQGDRRAHGLSDVVIASVQTLAAVNFKRLRRLIERHKFRLVIVDEAHHAAAPSYRTTLAYLGFLPPADMSGEEEFEAAGFDDVVTMEAALKNWDATAPVDRLLVGFTATPNRTDAIGLGCVFQSIAFSYPLRNAVADGWLVPPVPWVIETDTDLDGVKISHGDFNQRQLADAVNTEQRNKLAVAGWLEHAHARHTIAFTVDVAHAHALASEFRANGIQAAAVSGETPKDERRGILRRYTAGELQVITNCMVLTEGTDLPITSCILHAKPTKSATLYEQMTGRGLRLYPDKRDCILLDVVDVARRHSLMSTPALYGLPPNFVPEEGKTLDESADELLALIDRHPSLMEGVDGRVTLAQLRARAKTFDIWTVPPMGEYARDVSMKWIRRGDEFQIEYPWQDGYELLKIVKNLLGRFDLVASFRRVVKRMADGGRPSSALIHERILATDMGDPHIALRTAEGYVRKARPDVARIRAQGKSWQSNPPSEKQLHILRKWRIPIPEGCTSGQASEMISMLDARRR